MADEDELARLRAENAELRAKIAELQKNQWWHPAFDSDADNNLYTHDNYERTRNAAAYAWESLWYAHYNRHPIPWWVQEYLINLAWRIMELTGRWPRRLPSKPPPPNAAPPDPDLLQRRIAQAVNARADTGTTFRGFVGGIILLRYEQTGRKLDGDLIDWAMEFYDVTRSQAWEYYAAALALRRKREDEAGLPRGTLDPPSRKKKKG
ncbi:MAG: hypothetical protein U1E66_05220 [Rhodospirillales bacterium]